jgi:hypothetical protein
MGASLEELEAKLAVAPNRLMDLSLSTGVNIDFSAVAGFANVRHGVVLKNSIRHAPTDLHFGVARMFQTLITNPKIELRVFRNLAEAAEWVVGS